MLTFIFVFTSILNVSNAKGAEAPKVIVPVPNTPEDIEIELYLPLVLGEYPPPQSVFGAESTTLHPNYNAKAEDADIYWIRNSTFSWRAIEPNPPNANGKPSYDWSSVEENFLIDASSRELTVIAIIKYTPKWARKFPNYVCSPVGKNYLDEFARFMKDLVKKYSAEPYNIKYWEIGNEVDVDPSLAPPSGIYGCWGDINDKNYGGEYYGEMLKQVYPAIKAGDPNAKVLIGGLLLDCDPTYDSNCMGGRFFKGIMKETSGQYFDIVSFHSYAWFLKHPDGTIEIVDKSNPKWKHRGGVVMGKIDYLRQVMSQYGVDKPMLLTEGSLVCRPEDGCIPNEEFLDAQADYVVNLFSRIWQAKLLGAIWFTLEGPGWRDSGLLDGLIPKPAYQALDFMTYELYKANLTGKVTEHTNIEGFKFTRSDKNIWVLWSEDHQEHTISLPAGWNKVYDKFGYLIKENILGEDDLIDINSSTYIEILP